VNTITGKVADPSW